MTVFAWLGWTFAVALVVAVVAEDMARREAVRAAEASRTWIRNVAVPS